MEKFQANKAYYSEDYEGFTSSDEFDLKKRVQITNEIPPMDMFDMSHSMIKNDLWKWLLGYSFVSHDVLYNEETNGVETIDRDGYLIESSIAKYVNGVRAKDYGPKPVKVWNPNYKKDYQEYLDYLNGEEVEDQLTEDDFKYTIDYSQKYHRVEIDGALLPEMDLMLHEAYRYLSVLYPDHPDFGELLTRNEFEDEIAQSAALIDYKPNFQYFNWLSNYLDYSETPDMYKNDAIYDEASKMKIRNLTNHAFRRKFFGSKSGYKQFGADVFQHVSVFPAAQYVPYESYEDTRTEDEKKNPKNVDYKWFKKYYKKPKDLLEKSVNSSHVLYKKLFRLVDWNNESYDLLNRYKEPAKFYGTAHPTPYSQYTLYEYPLQRIIDRKDFEEQKDGLSTKLTIRKDFKVGQKVHVDGQETNWTKYKEGHISSITQESTFDVKCNLRYNESGDMIYDGSENGSHFKVSENNNALTAVNVDVSVQPIYTEFNIYPSTESLVKAIIEHDNRDDTIEEEKRIRTHKNDPFKEYYSATNFKDSIKALYEAFYTQKIQDKLSAKSIAYRLPTVGLFTPDPHQDGCLYMAPEQFMTTFEDTLKISLDTSEWTDENAYADETTPKSKIDFGITSMSDNGIVRESDIIEYENEETEQYFASQVLGISNAFVQFSIEDSKNTFEQIEDAIKEAEDAETARYGLVAELSENNKEAGKQKVVFFGDPIFGEPVETDSKGHYGTKSVYFNIKAIPRIKTHIQLREIYGEDFASICRQKFTALEVLIGDGDKKSIYGQVKSDLNNISSKFLELQVAFVELLKAAEENNLLYKDSHWKKLFKTSEKYLSSFEAKRPVLFVQLSHFYNNWVENTNISFEKMPPLEEIKKTVGELFETFEKYYAEYKNWELEEACIDVSKEHYYTQLSRDFVEVEKKTAALRLIEADDIIFNSMLPNRAFMLSPLPNDLLMRSWPTHESSYSLLTGQDKFVKIMSIGMNEYEDQLKWNTRKEFGSSGLLTNCMTYACNAWNFGSLNTATIVETHYDEEAHTYVSEDVKDNPDKVDFIDDFYNSSEDFIKKYEVLDYYAMLVNSDEDLENDIENDVLPYFSINKDIFTLMHKSDETHKFAYGDPNMMEVFLPDEKKNNIQGEVQSFNKVVINSHTTEDSNVISFEDEVSMERMAYISTGDQIIGTAIDDDVFIENINMDTHQITVSKPLNVTGEFELTYLCKIQFFPKENSEDFFKYRVAASKNHEAEQGSIFAHGIDGTVDYKKISQFILNPSIDIAAFRESVVTKLQEQTEYRSAFNKMCYYLYSKKRAGFLAQPSTPNCEGNMLLDINAYTTFDKDEFIMSYKTLNYFEEYIDEISRASDAVHIGVSINGYTRSDGNVTDDDAIKSRFVTTNDWKSGIPYYIKIGTGVLEDVFKKNNTVDNDSVSSKLRASFYGEAKYGEALYAASDENKKDFEDGNHFYDIAEPLFKAQLGEYEVMKNVNFSDYINKKFTTIQFAVMKRVVNDLIIKNNVRVINNNLMSYRIFADWPAALYTLEDGSLFVTKDESTKRFSYLGSWSPRTDENGNMNYPEKPFGNFISYYSIEKDEKLLVNGSQIEFRDGQFLIWDGNKWRLRDMLCCGFYGTNDTLSNFVKAHEKFAYSIDNFAEVDNGRDLKYCLLFKILCKANFVSQTSTLLKLTYEEMLSLYNAYVTNNEETLKAEVTKYKALSYKAVTNFLFDENASFWFEYIGSENYRTIVKPLGLDVGSTIGMLFLNGKFEICILNETLALYKLNTKNTLLSKDGVSNNEYLTFIGETCYSSTDKAILYRERLDKYQSTYNLNGFTDLIPGTARSNIRLSLGNKTTGWKYNGTKVDYDNEIEVDLTKDYIYVDDENKVLYTFNDGEKVAIKQENNKYFKNIIHNIVQYVENTELTQDGLVTTGSLVPVDDFSFDGSSMTLFDRILEINRVDIRSDWNVSLESTLFSKYTNIEGVLRGIFYDGDTFDIDNPGNNVELNLGYSLSLNPQSFINKSKFIVTENKVKPQSEDGKELYTEDRIIFGESTFKDDVISSPLITGVKAYDEDDVAEGIEYYKNKLILEGRVDLAEPTRIYFTSSKSQDALNSVIALNDDVIDCVPLETSNVDNFNKYGIQNVKAIDWKNNIFVVATTDEVYFINCATLDTLGQLDENGNKVPFITTDPANFIKMTYPGDEAKLTSLVWDDTYARWILTLESSDGVYAGTYYYKVQNSNVGAPSITDSGNLFVNDPTLEHDFDEYQFINVLKNMDEETISRIKDVPNENGVHFPDAKNIFNGKEYSVLARDFAFSYIDEDCYTSSERKIGNITLSQGKTNVFDNEDRIPENTQYVDIHFECEAKESGKPYSLSLEDIGAGYYTYDTSLGRWMYSSVNSYKYIVKNQMSKTKVHLIVTTKDIITAENLYENGIPITKKLNSEGVNAEQGTLGEFLWLLPRPVNKDEIYFVEVLDSGKSVESFQLKATLSDVKITNYSARNLKIINQGKLYNEELDPVSGQMTLKKNYENGFYCGHYEKPIMMAYNHEGYMVALNGDKLFVKSPTMTWNKGNYNTITDSKYWKMGQIPNMRDLSYKLFENETTEEIYQKVKEQKEVITQYLKELVEVSHANNSQQKALYDFLKSYELVTPKDFLEEIKNDKFDYTNGLFMYGVVFEQTGNGKVANFITSGKNNFVQYDIPQNLDIQGGVTTKVYLREQTYINYLRDFYEIILGCNRLSNVVEDGVKSLKITDTAIVIVTKTEDVISLPLGYTYTRDDIENYNNWNVASLCEAMELPNYGLDSSKRKQITYGINGEFHTFTTDMASTIKKLYTINCSYVYKNVQVYAGYYKVDDAAAAFYRKIGVLKDGITVPDYNYPFVAYSVDNGRTFTYSNLTTTRDKTNPKVTGPYEGYDFTCDAQVDEIYKQGSKIYIICTGTDGRRKSTEYQLDLLTDEYSLTPSNVWSPDLNRNEMQFNFGKWVDAGEVNGSYNYILTENNFYINNLGFEGVLGSVLTIGSNYIDILPDGEIASNKDGGMIKVLVGLKTAASITNQASYIDNNEEIFKSDGEIKLNPILRVDSYATANRAYVRNEVNPLNVDINKNGIIDEDEMKQSVTGFTCLAVDNVDSRRTVYSYSETANSKGETVYTPIDQMNDDGDPVVLFDKESGRFLFERNPVSLFQSSCSLEELIKKNGSVESCALATVVNENYEFKSEDTLLAEIFNNKTLKLSSAVFDTSNPYVSLVSYKMSESLDGEKSIIKQLHAYDKTAGSHGLFYTWPFDDKLTYTDEAVSAMVDGARTPFLAKLKVMQKEADLSFTYSSICEMFEPIQIIANDKGFIGVREKSSNTILFEERTLDLTMSMPYVFNGGFKSYKNKAFNVYEESPNTLLEINGDIINSVHLNVKGYGGTLGNDEWNNKLPWENDAKAFEDVLLYNKNNENIYLCNENGLSLTMNNGLFWLYPKETSPISWKKLAKQTNIAKVREGDYNTQSANYNFYKLDNSKIDVYCPYDYVKFNYSENDENLLTVFKLHKAGIEISENRNDRYVINFIGDLYADIKCTVLLDLNLRYENGKIIYGKNLNENVYCKGDILTVEIIDTLDGSVTHYNLNVSQVIAPVVKDIECFQYLDETSSSYINIELDSEFDDVITYDENIIKVDTTPTTAKFFFSSEPNEKTFTIIDNFGIKTNYVFDCQTLKPILYVNKEWTTSDKGEDILVKVYSGDQDITDRFTTVFEFDKETNVLKLKVLSSEGFTKFEKVFDYVETTSLNTDIDFGDKFVFTISDSEITYKNNNSSVKYLIEGLYGNTMLLKPKYKNLKDLISNLDRIIYFDKSESLIYKYEDGSLNNNSFTEITDSSAVLKNVFTNVDTSDETYLCVRILPVKSIRPDISYLNNDEYYTEISLDDIELYSYDRVYLNEKVFLAPPVKYNGVYYNSENLSQYSVEPWKNKDDFKVYLTDEDGRFVKGMVVNNTLQYEVIGDVNGDCSSEIYQSVDPRLNASQLQWNTTFEYYKSRYYSTKERSNPFFKYIKINDIIENSEVVQRIETVSSKAENNRIIYQKDGIVSAQKAISYDIDETLNVIGTAERDYYTYGNAELKLFVFGPDESEKNNETNVLAGIIYTNPFYINTSSYWSDNEITVSSKGTFDFAVDSTENVANPEKSCIADITEVGVFDKDDRLIAYMAHPKCQYDTKKNHIAYNLIIEE